MTENIADLIQLAPKMAGESNLTLYGLLEVIAFFLVVIAGAYLVLRYYPKIVEGMV